MNKGESDPLAMLRNMKPTLNAGVFVFVRWPHEYQPTDVPTIMSFREREGMTLIVEESVASAHGFNVEFRAAWIELEVHSDLRAIGFLNAVIPSLNGAGISCNVVSAIFHDHLFVPVERGQDAVKLLNGIWSSILKY